MLRRALLALILAGVWLAPRPSAADSPPFGRWLTADREGVIEIFPCAAGFCGRVVGMTDRTGPDGGPLRDKEGQPRCGLVILRETEQVEPNLWRARITNPDDGNVWRCELWIEGGVLHLRGYVLIPLLGRTTDWTRYDGRIGPQCLMG